MVLELGITHFRLIGWYRHSYFLACLIYEGKSLNKSNLILNCMKKYVQRKILFRDTKWLLSNMPYRGHDDQAVWACAIARTTWPFHCQLPPWKYNEALFILLWSEGVKPSEICRRTKVQYADSCLSQVRMYGWVEIFQNGTQTLMNIGMGDSLAWQLRRWNSRSRSEYVTTGESLLMKLPYNSAWGTALRTVLFMTNSGVGKCVADVSQGSCLMIISVHCRRFVSRIWTVMLVKEMLFSIELCQETIPGCTILNQTVRDNRFNGRTLRPWPTKNSRQRFPLVKSCWPSFVMSIDPYWCTSRKRVKPWLVLGTVTC